MTHATPRGQRGAALLEAMIAILILSFGLLGMVGMQTAAVKYEQNSWARSAVSSLASDMADRIRANPDVASTAYSGTSTYAAERTAMSDGSAFTVTTDCGATACTPAQLAAYDAARWRRALNDQIPGAVGQVQGSRGGGYTVTIAWFDRSQANATDTFDLNASSLPPAPVCSTATANTVEQRNCCPDSLAPPNGVRCVGLVVLP